MRVRPLERKSQTSRSSSSFVNTRDGSPASFSKSSYSLAASTTGRPASVTHMVDRSMRISPASTVSRAAAPTRRSTARMQASSSS